MNNPVNVALLDLGGVVVDVDLDAGRAAWQRRTSRSGSDFDRVFFESGVKDAMDIGQIDADEGLNQVCALTNGAVSPAEARACFNAILSPRPQVTRVIEALAKASRIGVISNTDPIHAGFIRERCGIDHVVEAWTLSCDVGALKPDPPLYLAALDAMSCSASEALLIDDRRDNLEAAAALGIRGVRFETLDQTAAELRGYGLIP